MCCCLFFQDERSLFDINTYGSFMKNVINVLFFFQDKRRPFDINTYGSFMENVITVMCCCFFSG